MVIETNAAIRVQFKGEPSVHLFIQYADNTCYSLFTKLLNQSKALILNSVQFTEVNTYNFAWCTNAGQNEKNTHTFYMLHI